MKNIIALLLGFFCLNAFAADPSRPNFVMVIVDDLGRQDVGAYGGQFYETPNIDSLSANGMRFDNAYVAHPRCLPSRLGFLSGRYPASYGIPGFQDRKIGRHALPLSTTTFAEILGDAGYQTAYIGKWHLGKEGGEPRYQGFDTSIMAGAAGATPNHFLPYETPASGKANKDFEAYEGGETGEYLTDRLTDEALNYIEQQKEKAFLLVLAHYAVHTPIQAPEPLVEKYREKIRENEIPEGGPKADKDIVTDNTGSVKTVQNHPVYAAMVDSVDQNLGRIVAKLDELKLSDNTVIILTSDHGGLSSRGLNSTRELATSNLPYRHGKGWLYEGGIRVPMVVKWPAGIQAGSVSQVQVTGTDHYPTLLELAGLPLQPDHHRDGRSYLQALHGKDYQREPMFWHSSLGRPEQTGDTRSSAVINGNWKLIQWYSLEDESIERVELYNLASDPYEQSDVAEQNPAQCAELGAMLDDWKQSVNARLGAFKKGGV